MVLTFVNDTSLWAPHSAFVRGVRVSNSYWIAGCPAFGSSARTKIRKCWVEDGHPAFLVIDLQRTEHVARREDLNLILDNIIQ